MDFTVSCRRIHIAASSAGEEGIISAWFTDSTSIEKRRVQLELTDIPSDLVKQIQSGEDYHLSITLTKTNKQ